MVSGNHNNSIVPYCVTVTCYVLRVCTYGFWEIGQPKPKPKTKNKDEERRATTPHPTMSDASSPQPPSVLPPVAADNQEDRHQFPKTVMIALKQQTEFIKSLENSLYLAMRPLTNGRFVLPSLPAQTTEDEDGDETINPVAVLEIIRQQNEAIISLQKSVSKMRPIIIKLVASCQNGGQQHINERKSPTNTRRGGAAAASASIPVGFHTNIKYRTSIQRNNTPISATTNTVRPKNFAEACCSYLTRARESSRGGIQSFNLPLLPHEEGVDTTDEDIDAIVESRKDQGLWPVRRNTYKQFTIDEELVKVRFHRSQKYPHLP